MKFTAWKLGFNIKEVAIAFEDRKIGTSKMSGRILKEGVFGVLEIQFKSWFNNYHQRMRVEKPISKKFSNPVEEV